jgi:hypothetical protein
MVLSRDLWRQLDPGNRHRRSELHFGEKVEEKLTENGSPSIKRHNQVCLAVTLGGRGCNVRFPSIIGSHDDYVRA